MGVQDACKSHSGAIAALAALIAPSLWLHTSLPRFSASLHVPPACRPRSTAARSSAIKSGAPSSLPKRYASQRTRAAYAWRLPTVPSPLSPAPAPNQYRVLRQKGTERLCYEKVWALFVFIHFGTGFRHFSRRASALVDAMRTLPARPRAHAVAFRVYCTTVYSISIASRASDTFRPTHHFRVTRWYLTPRAGRSNSNAITGVAPRAPRRRAPFDPHNHALHCSA